jgi:hypothetical protein
VTTYGSIPLRDVIRNASSLDAGDANAISEYLAENLIWGIQMVCILSLNSPVFQRGELSPSHPRRALPPTVERGS